MTNAYRFFEVFTAAFKMRLSLSVNEIFADAVLFRLHRRYRISVIHRGSAPHIRPAAWDSASSPCCLHRYRSNRRVDGTRNVRERARKRQSPKISYCECVAVSFNWPCECIKKEFSPRLQRVCRLSRAIPENPHQTRVSGRRFPPKCESIPSQNAGDIRERVPSR